VVRASDDELAAHERVLAVIDKLSGGQTVWRREVFTPQTAESERILNDMPVPVPA
jgi:hypothetical protein